MTGRTAWKLAQSLVESPDARVVWSKQSRAEVKRLLLRLLSENERLRQAEAVLWEVINGYLAPPNTEFDWDGWYERAKSVTS
jgi:hypothetical protein